MMRSWLDNPTGPRPGPRRPLRAGALAALLLAGPAWSQPAEVRQAVQVEQRIDVQLDLEADPAEPSPNEAVKGFGFSQVPEETAEQIAQFQAHLDEGAWEKAFKGFSELRENTRGRLTRVAGSGRFVPVGRLVADRVEAMPAEGRETFRLYFDAYAAELLAQVEQHPQPGSYEQFRLARELFDWFALTSSGARAGELAGDLCFERGRYLEAAECWERALRLHPGSRPEAWVQARRALALMRAGQVDAAMSIREGLAQRYTPANEPTVRLGGQDLAVTRFLNDEFDQLRADPANRPATDAHAQHAAHAPIALPEEGTDPRWAFTIVSPAIAKRIANPQNNRRGYVDSLMVMTPPIALDERRVYGHWMGSVFALDLSTGKLQWQTLPFNLAVNTASERGSFHNNQNDYRIALTDDAVLVVDAAPSDRTGLFVLTAYDKQTGRILWDSTASLYDRSVCGQPLYHNGQVYLTTRPRNQGSGQLVLHELDAGTGQPQWSAQLGEMDLQQSPYALTGQSIQPVLHATDRHVMVLTNNGALVAVDCAAGEVSWGLELVAPAHLESDEPFIRARLPDQNTIPNTTPGGVVQIGQTLYLKESLSRRAYAIDLDTQAVRWTKQVDSLFAELGGEIDGRLVLISNGLELLNTDGKNNRTLDANNFGMPGANVLAGTDALYLLTNGQIVRASIKPPYEVQGFSNRYLFNNEGGRLYAAKGLIICVSKSGLVAYPTPTRSAAADNLNPPTP